MGIKKFLKEGLECSRVGENSDLTNSGFRFFVMKNIVNRGVCSRMGELKCPLQSIDLKFLQSQCIYNEYKGIYLLKK